MEPKQLNKKSAVKPILVVEDNLMNQKYINSLLDKWALKYDLAENGQAALRLINQKVYQLILMDLEMPVMNGYDTTIHIRNTKNSNQNTPIVALTASALLKKKSRALEIGMMDFLTKPFTPTQLKQIIEEYIESPLSDEPISGSSKEAPQMDYAYLSELFMGDKYYALEIFELFLDYGLQEIKRLEENYQQKNWAIVKQLTHKLKASISMVGYPHLSRNLELMEKAVVEEKLEELNRAYAQFKRSFSEVLPKIEATCKQLKSTPGDFFSDFSLEN